ncbi:response regulator [Rhodobacter sp. NTK016B]|uniref:response regulator n=1 Tax=Rhodobacter sp. NTK016B TaxID=2759676 RepID=UPI001A8F8BA9|nr:response regulator [Rhodobacter sp. NTK016B]MBN8292905.1 response regulator [Rhodobacter sp. NTK016B]
MKLRILQVDDDPHVLEISRIALQDIGGNEVFQFSNGREAIDNAAALSPDVILLDLMMPQFGGRDVLQGLREIESCSDTPVLFLTGRTDSASTSIGSEPGVIGFLRKPFDAMTLSQSILDAMGLGKAS